MVPSHGLEPWTLGLQFGETRILRHAAFLGITDRFITDIFNEQHHQCIICILASLQRAAKRIATLPQAVIEVGLFDSRCYLSGVIKY